MTSRIYHRLSRPFAYPIRPLYVARPVSRDAISPDSEQERASRDAGISFLSLSLFPQSVSRRSLQTRLYDRTRIVGAHIVRRRAPAPASEKLIRHLFNREVSLGGTEDDSNEWLMNRIREVESQVNRVCVEVRARFAS
jgi:hypothetical protein